MKRSLIVIGVLMMLYAVIGAVTHAGGVFLFLAAVLIAHDAIWMPLVLLAGRFLRRPATRIAAVVAAALTAAALPLALGVGRAPDNPSALPLHYARNLALVLAVIGVAALVGRKDFTSRRRRKGR
jgi:fucose 4-O-acetylase-like acetyltransferase